MTDLATVSAAGPAATASMSDPVRPDGFSAALRDLRDGFALTELWLYLGWRDVRRHYSRSMLGPFWLTLSMGIMIGSLGLLYSRIFRMEIRDYLPFLSVGFVLWNLIGGSVSGACGVFTGAAGYVRQVRLPLSVHMLKFVWNQVVVFLHNFAIYVAVAVLFGLRPGFEVLLALPAVALISLNALFAAMVLGPLCARFRDVPMIVGNAVQVAFFLTPVIWHPEQLAERSLLVQANPFYHFIEIARDPLLGDVVRAGNWIAALSMTAVFGLAATAFYGRFRTRIAYWA